MKAGKSFKLLAIRPLVGCAPKYLKALTAGQLYPFYNNYKFYFNEDDPNEPVIKITVDNPALNDTISNKLYDLGDGKPTVSVAAVVGKNGSGKSTLFDLFYLGVYLVSKAYDILKRPADYVKPWHLIEISDSDKQQLHDKYEEIKEILARNAKENFFLDPLSENLSEQLGDWEETNEKVKGKTHQELRGEEQKKYDKEFEDLLRGAMMECYYEKDGEYYMFYFDGGPITKLNLKKFFKEGSGPENTRFTILEKQSNTGYLKLSEHFFYTISMSYAHYGLNETIEGSWVKQLFHKNDGYQTPLVINPMRDKGNIDINKENVFAVQRLLSNILDPKNNEVQKDSKKGLTENLRTIAFRKVARWLTFEFDSKKEPPLTKVDGVMACVTAIYQAYTRGLETATGVAFDEVLGNAMAMKDNTEIGSACRYLCNKIVKICRLYEDYKPWMSGNAFYRFGALPEQIKNDKSHITFKLKQAMNYIRFQMIESNEIKVVNLSEGQSLPDENPPYVTIQDLSQRIEKHIKESDKQNPLTVIELLPPPIFKVEIILEDGSSFSKMSSGEKQKIYTLSSIVYHLINVNSVHEKVTIRGKKDDDGIIRYSSINILFDEVEQYFHPELQRTFVKDLLGYLDRINEMHVKHINSIQILFATHSPFILSDIPSENVLMLENGEIKEANALTFAANINEMLADNFFMEGSIGAYAEVKIKDLLEFSRRVDAADESEIIKMKSEYEQKRKLFYFVTNATGEGYMRSMLENHLEDIEVRLGVHSRLDSKIVLTQGKLERLKKLKNDSSKIQIRKGKT